jgi:phosphohistidine phosphatase
MNLYLIRHADALPLGSEGVASDAERPLSKVGYQQLAALAAGLKRLGQPFDVIATSPLLRCKQAAEELVRLLEMPKLDLATCDFLAPGESSKKLTRWLRRLDGSHVMLVGHEPDLGRHTGYLIGSKRARIEFAKGACACVVCDNPPRKATGTLLWMVNPQWLGTR